MRKLICVLVFISLGCFVASAQNAPTDPTIKLVPVSTKMNKKDSKANKSKENCSTSEKKKCAEKSSGKSCCSHKEEEK